IYFFVAWIARQVRRQLTARGIDRRLKGTGRGVGGAIQVEMPTHTRGSERSKCGATGEEPVEREDVISVSPAMRPNCRSRGVATDEAMVSGLAPGNRPCTWMVGKSTCGKGETGKKK